MFIHNNQNIFALVYRPPGGNVESFFFLRSLMLFLVFINEGKYNLIWGGDFNIDMSADTKVKIYDVTYKYEWL